MLREHDDLVERVPSQTVRDSLLREIQRQVICYLLSRGRERSACLKDFSAQAQRSEVMQEAVTEPVHSEAVQAGLAALLRIPDAIRAHLVDHDVPRTLRQAFTRHRSRAARRAGMPCLQGRSRPRSRSHCASGEPESADGTFDPSAEGRGGGDQGSSRWARSSASGASRRSRVTTMEHAHTCANLTL